MAVRVPPVMRRVRSATRGRPRLPARLNPRRARIFAFLGLLGPGLIAANAGNDAGGVATYSSIGAKYGYDLLWTIVLIGISLAIVQLLAARMGVVTGKGLAELIREEYGIRWSVLATSAVLVASTDQRIPYSSRTSSASPLPVTTPMRAASSCTIASEIVIRTIVHSSP